MRALVKLEQVLPAHLRRRVQALQRATQTLQVYGSGPTVDPQCLTTLAAAVRDHERVRFNYTARDKAGSKREAEPHSLVNAGRRWYLVAWDCGRTDWRTFRVDRIERVAADRRALRARARSPPPTPPPTSSRACATTARATRRASPCTRPRTSLAGASLARRRHRRSTSTTLRGAHQRRQPRLAGDADRDDHRALRGPRAARADRAAARDRPRESSAPSAAEAQQPAEPPARAALERPARHLAPVRTGRAEQLEAGA